MSNLNSQDWLRKWLQGDLTLTEEQQLRQAAKTDPFLADALAGLEGKTEHNHLARMASLQTRLQNKTQAAHTPKIVGLGMRKWAAVAALLIFAVGSMWWIGQVSQNTSNLAQQETIEKSAAPTTAAEPEIAAKVNEEIITETKEEDSIKPAILQNKPSPQAPKNSDHSPIAMAESNPPVATKQTTPTVYEVVTERVTSPIAKEETEAEIEAEAIVEIPPSPKEEVAMAPPSNLSEIRMEEAFEEGYTEEVADEIIKEKDKVAEIKTRSSRENYVLNAPPVTSNNIISRKKTRKAKAKEWRRLKGKITDENGQALVDATISSPDEKYSTVTNFDGNYTLDIPTDVKDMVVSYIGFETRVQAINYDEIINIQMRIGSVPLDGVVARILTPDQDAPIATGIDENIQKVFPKQGFRAYRKYIKKALKYPKDAKEKGIEGNVKLSFSIDSNGNPVDFKVLKSLSETCDQEAIRLLEEGKAWIPVKGYKGERVNYKVKFSLKK